VSAEEKNFLRAGRTGLATKLCTRNASTPRGINVPVDRKDLILGGHGVRKEGGRRAERVRVTTAYEARQTFRLSRGTNS